MEQLQCILSYKVLKPKSKYWSNISGIFLSNRRPYSILSRCDIKPLQINVMKFITQPCIISDKHAFHVKFKLPVSFWAFQRIIKPWIMKCFAQLVYLINHQKNTFEKKKEKKLAFSTYLNLFLLLAPSTRLEAYSTRWCTLVFDPFKDNDE